MIYIDKSQEISKAGIIYIDNWLNSYRDETKTFTKAIQEIKEDANPKKGERIWSLMTNKKNLKQSLLREQGFVCCYCGQRIFNNEKTPIEHLKPKSLRDSYGNYQNLDDIYNYQNLMASCAGSAKRIIHIVQENTETISSIAEFYEISPNRIEELYVDDTNFNIVRKEYDIENLQEGDRVLIVEPLPEEEQHCDTKKGKIPIFVHPLIPNCEDKFTYILKGLEVVIKEKELGDEVTRNSINTLGLNNNRQLNRQRKTAVDKARLLKNQIIKQTGTERIRKLRAVINHYSNQNEIYAPESTIEDAILFRPSFWFIYLAVFKNNIRVEIE